MVNVGASISLRLILSLSKDEAFTGRAATLSFERHKMRPHEVGIGFGAWRADG